MMNKRLGIPKSKLQMRNGIMMKKWLGIPKRKLQMRNGIMMNKQLGTRLGMGQMVGSMPNMRPIAIRSMLTRQGPGHECISDWLPCPFLCLHGCYSTCSLC